MSPDIFVVLLLLQVLFTLWVSIVIFRKSILEPVVLFNLPWLVPLSVVMLGIFEYQFYLVFRSYLIMALVLLAFSLGCYWVVFAIKKRQSKNHNDKNINIYFLWDNRKWQKFMFILVIIYGFAVFGAISQKIPLSNLLGTNLTELRGIHWGNLSSGFQNLFEGIKTITRPFIILNAIALAFYSKITNKNLFLFSSFLSFAFLTIESFGQGGRILIAFTSLNFFYSFMFVKFSGSDRRKKVKKQRTFITIAGLTGVALILVYFFLVWFPAARNPNLSNDFSYYLGLSNPVRLSNRGAKLVEIFGNQAYSALFGLSYFSNPVATLTLYYLHSDFTDWYYLGGYTFPVFSKFLNLLQGTPYDWLQIRNRLSAVPAGLGYSSNPWATGIRDLLIDYGEPGTLLFMLGFGWTAQLIYKKTKLHPSDINILLISLISSVIFVFSFFGYIHNGYFFYPLLVIITVKVLLHNNHFLQKGQQ